MGKAKFQRQGTYAPQESDILSAIDEKFEELEETIILASLVPQLHERLHALEQMLKIGTSPLSTAIQEAKARKEKEKHKGPQWGDTSSPPPIRPPEDHVNAEEDLDKGKTTGETEDPDSSSHVKVGISDAAAEINDLMALSPARRREVKRITDISRSKVSEMDEKTLDTQTSEYYTFGESTWDLVIFIGTGALGPLGSLQTILLAIINVVFCAIAWFNFTSPDINEDSITDTLRWRRSSGHSYADYSPVAKESLVHRVCKMDKSLESSGIQVDLIENINKYLKSEETGLEGFFTGQILCIVALICWYLMVAKEVSHALALHRGVIAVPRGATKLDTRENPFTQVTHYRLRAVALRRKIASGFLLLYRLVAAALLLYVGTNFLVYTVNVTELILNAVALGIILDIDDLLFDAMATTPGRHLVHQLDPLHMPSLPRIRGADAKSVFMSMFIPALTILVYFSMLEPFVGTLDGVRIAMCGGNQNFVWSLDKRRITQLSPTYGGGWEEEEESIKTDAIMEGESLTSGFTVNNSRYGFWVNSVNVLSDVSVMSLDTMVDSANTNCGDIGNEEPMLNYLRYFLANDSIQGCADAAPYCNSITKMPEYAVDDGRGYAARMLCSATCGCNIPGGEFINVQGCPYGAARACDTTTEKQQFVESAVCVEKDASTLRAYPPWKAWVETIRSYGNQASNYLSGKADALILARAMEDNGCDFLANLSAQNVSLGGCFSWNSKFSWEFKTLEVFCPVTCGCAQDSPEGSGCPTPFGYTCVGGEVKGCLTWDGKHFCEGFNAEVLQADVQFSVLDFLLASDYALQIMLALQTALAQKASVTQPVDPQTIQLEIDFDWELSAKGMIWLIEDGMNATAMSSALFSTTLQELQAAVTGSLESSGVPVNDLGFVLTSFSNPNAIYGPYGYGDGYDDLLSDIRDRLT
eukprot:s646_g11.t1